MKSFILCHTPVYILWAEKLSSIFLQVMLPLNHFTLPGSDKEVKFIYVGVLRSESGKESKILTTKLLLIVTILIDILP